ncbi:MAG: hypothetical protein HZB67_05580 [Candidatus Aenigmarchaeota archaeon]|nr:hypothetical protein [Candidatus Aenigmarchaeota archaeon]
MQMKNFLRSALAAAGAAAMLATATPADAHALNRAHRHDGGKVIIVEHTPYMDRYEYHSPKIDIFFGQYRNSPMIQGYPGYRPPVIINPGIVATPRPYGSFYPRPQPVPVIVPMPVPTVRERPVEIIRETIKEVVKQPVNEYNFDIHDNINTEVYINTGSENKIETHEAPDVQKVQPIPQVPQPVQQPIRQKTGYRKGYPSSEILCGQQAKGVLVSYLQWGFDNDPSYPGFSVKQESYMPHTKIPGDVVVLDGNGWVVKVYEMTTDGDKNQALVNKYLTNCYGKRTTFIRRGTEQQLMNYVNRDFGFDR